MQAVPLRRLATLVAVLLAGLLVHLGGMTGTVVAALADGDAGAGDAAGAPVSSVEAAAETTAPPAVLGRTWTSAWHLATTRAAATAVTLVLAAAWLARQVRHRPVVAWRLSRPDRTLPTARHISPLAARRAPPAPAGC